jgi:hypothetical protein
MQSGTSLYLAIVIMIILLAIALGLATIFLGQVEIVREMGYSVIAFYAADAGIEKVLIDRGDPLPLDGYSDTLENGSSYILSVFSSGYGGCTAPYFCIKSIGTYKEINRSIEIMY